ncbi:MAG: TlyA family RNA methyltransferase [Nitrospirae bacterium]|nr:TlyA family RNA methyltransferase [Nitrospirota bacterium]
MVERGLAQSRERAKALVMAGNVLVNGQPALKAGIDVNEDVLITLRGDDIPFVSRGGLKLAHALEVFSIDTAGKIAMDVGASTGGFTDCLLKGGAMRVYAVDVGYGQLAWALRTDPRVVPVERTNIRILPKEAVPEEVDIITIDVSFISLKIVIPAALKFLKRAGGQKAETTPPPEDKNVPCLLCLVKPQFEVGKGEVGKGGIVRDEERRLRVLEDMKSFVASLGLKVAGTCESPIKGQKGNVEYFIHVEVPDTKLV